MYPRALTSHEHEILKKLAELEPEKFSPYMHQIPSLEVTQCPIQNNPTIQFVEPKPKETYLLEGNYYSVTDDGFVVGILVWATHRSLVELEFYDSAGACESTLQLPRADKLTTDLGSLCPPLV